MSRGGLLGGFKKSHFALEAAEEEQEEEEFAREPSASVRLARSRDGFLENDVTVKVILE